MADELIMVETLKAEIVFAPGGVDAILDNLEKQVRTTPTDISTKAGRAAVSSLAFKVARSKTALDDLGKGLVTDWKLRSALVDAERRRIRERLDDLRDEVRKPLTEWEEAERQRVLGHEQFLVFMTDFTKFDTAEPTAEFVSQRIDKFESLKSREWHEFAKRAVETAAQVRRSLQASLEAAVRREAERAELERLRREAKERAQREREERIRVEAAAMARVQAEIEAREAARKAHEAAEHERTPVEREKQAAEEKMRAAQAAAEKADRDRLEAAERAERASVAAAEKAERDAAAAVEAESARVAEAKRAEKAEAARREADKRHRENVHREIAAELVNRGFTKRLADEIVIVLATRGVSHVRITY